MSLAKEILGKLVNLINDDVAPNTKVWCLSLPISSFEQMIDLSRRWLTNLGVEDWGLGRWKNISIQ